MKPVTDRLNEEWDRIAPAWITEMREGRNANRRGLLDAPMLEVCGDVRGCAYSIAAATQLATESDAYQVADAQDLSFLKRATFDLAISYLNQCDLTDFEANNREIFRVLKPGGRFVVANVHPMRSAVGKWHKNPDGQKQHVILDRYFDEGERSWAMLGSAFTNFHRTLATYFSAYRAAGFAVEEILEPSPEMEQVERYPELEDELRVPIFIIFVLRKDWARAVIRPAVRLAKQPPEAVPESRPPQPPLAPPRPLRTSKDS